MSQELINRSPDLKRLRAEGFDICIKSNHLLVSSIPYLNRNKESKFGTIVTVIDWAGSVTSRPGDHQVHFIGEIPCDTEARELNIRSNDNAETLAPGITKQYSFSSKPTVGYYVDYYEKINTYYKIISSPAISLNKSLTAKTFRVKDENAESVFKYIDSFSPKAGIENISCKLSNLKIAIVGLGGTGGYVLDFVSKTKVKEIHLYDEDIFMQHNAFRSPGAAPEDLFDQRMKKVDYLSSVYSKMHNHIFPHGVNLNQDNIENLGDVDFVFLCLDKGEVKKQIFDFLETKEISFIDVGMGIEKYEDSLFGTLRVTTSTKDMRGHIQANNLVSYDEGQDNNLYSTNIQVSELNALNAALAVIKWKKLYCFYIDHIQEHHSLFNVGGNKIANRFDNS